MRRGRTISRILLIVFVANVVLAAPVLVRQRHLDVAEVASEKRDPGLDDEATGRSASDSMPKLASDPDESCHLSDSGSTDSRSDRYFLVRKSLDDSLPESPSSSSHDLHQDWPPTTSFHEGEGQLLHFPEMLHSPWYSSEDSASHHGSVPGSPSGSSGYDSAPESLSGSSHLYDSAAESLVGSSLHSSSEWSIASDSDESSSLHDWLPDSSSGSSHEDRTPTMPVGSFHEGDGLYLYHTFPFGWWRYWRLDQSLPSPHSSAPASPESSHQDSEHESSTGSMPELVSDSEESVNSPEPESDPSRYLTAPASGSTSSHYGSAPVSADTSTHDESAPTSAAPPTHDNSVPVTATPPTHDDLTPVSGAPLSHDDPSPTSGTPPHDNPPPASGTAPLHDDLGELIHEIRGYSVLGTVAGTSTIPSSDVIQDEPN